MDDYFNSNLIAELHDITFEKLPNLTINEAGGMGISSFPLRYRARRHCEEPYFAEYGYDKIGIYEKERLDEYYTLKAQKKEGL